MHEVIGRLRGLCYDRSDGPCPPTLQALSAAAEEAYRADPAVTRDYLLECLRQVPGIPDVPRLVRVLCEPRDPWAVCARYAASAPGDQDPWILFTFPDAHPRPANLPWAALMAVWTRVRPRMPAWCGEDRSITQWWGRAHRMDSHSFQLTEAGAADGSHGFLTAMAQDLPWYHRPAAGWPATPLMVRDLAVADEAAAGCLTQAMHAYRTQLRDGPFSQSMLREYGRLIWVIERTRADVRASVEAHVAAQKAAKEVNGDR